MICIAEVKDDHLVIARRISGHRLILILPQLNWSILLLSKRGTENGKKHHKPEEIVLKLRQVDLLVGQGMPVQLRSGKLVSPSKRIGVGVVISPFVAGCFDGIYAAFLSFCAGAIPPVPMFVRSLLQVHSQHLLRNCLPRGA